MREEVKNVKFVPQYNKEDVFVLKLWSLNPNQYTEMELNDAIEKYVEWRIHCFKSPFTEIGEKHKSFYEWLETEI